MAVKGCTMASVWGFQKQERTVKNEKFGTLQVLNLLPEGTSEKQQKCATLPTLTANGN